MAVGSRDVQVAAGDDKRLRKDFGTIGLLFTAVGSIIGSGWLFGALTASEMAGPASVFSWAVGAVIFILIGLTFAELGTMFPHSGGVARYPQYSHGSFASFIIGWITWIAAAAVAPIEVLACVQYAKNYLPWIQTLRDGVPVLTTPGLGVSIGLMAVFTIVNFFGVRWFARINNILVWWKLFIIVLVVVALITVSFNGDHFSATAGFAPFGAAGVFSAVSSAGIAFAYLGFRQGVELAGETDNPKRNVPLTVVGSVVICGVIYVALQFAFIGASPTDAITAEGWSKVGEHIFSGSGTPAEFGPLAALAGTVGLVWLAGLLYADAIISPADTGLIYNGVSARISYAMGRNRNAPKGLAAVSKNGVPWVSLLLAFVIGCLFFLPFPGWQSLVGFVTSSTVLSFGAGPLVLLALRRRLPERERPFRLPAAWVISFLALWASNLVVYWTGWEKDRFLFIAVAIGFVLFGINQAVARGRTPTLHFKNGWWIIVWLGGLCLISYLGGFGSAADPSKNVGNLDLYGLLGGAIWTFILAAVTVFLAYWFALPREQIETILAEHRGEGGGGEGEVPAEA
ncbi:MAG: APC family permease [Streptosporangiales bacterium]